jgi:acid phosphatase
MRTAFLFCWAAVVPAQPISPPNTLVWMQNAAEYRALALQAYRAATANLERALRDPRWTAALEQIAGYEKSPPAIILDLDETVLDNGVFLSRLALTGAAFTDASWQKWVAEKRAGLVPGAREFLLRAQSLGVQVFYVTNRTCHPEDADDPTVAVLRMHVLPFGRGRLLCRTDTSDKSPRRKAVADASRILLLIGDDLNDFVTLPFDIAARTNFISDTEVRWGERWFMIPNPAYGSWERAIPDKEKALRQ